jgi:protein TonB
MKKNLKLSKTLLPAILALLMAIPAFSQDDPQVEKQEEAIFKVVEQMPRFPGCEDKATDKEKYDCAQMEMLKYLYTGLSYPAEARKNGVEGMVLVQFVVNEEGYIEDAKIVRDIGAGCGQASLDVINSMNDMDERWIPGKQRGEKVKVMYSLPINFKLDSAKDKKE